METFESYLFSIINPEYRSRMRDVLEWVIDTYPNLEPLMKWDKPMFADHGTFIIGFSVAKHHISISPEAAGIAQFTDDLDAVGYTYTDGLFRIRWNKPVHYDLLKKMIDFNIEDKADFTKFWREE
ncbi:iron chaperone [Ornithinibacillus gellani]|uniref:iron chaperone n=1 Tax=Ornithinibacillus gellani TaxID=2293253 RepID=UPI000F460671|nr:iron chaperone [Ornithinibacillus gellani]TQS75052.1 iron chaperone [Ornithinibacillus gellani]